MASRLRHLADRRLISSSVSESSAEVASSKTSSRGRRSSARAIDDRCFSPPETFTPPSPISVSRPRSARARRLRPAPSRAPPGTRRRWRPGCTNCRFSRIEPENSWVSWVTKPMRSAPLDVSFVRECRCRECGRFRAGIDRPGASPASSCRSRKGRRKRRSRRGPPRNEIRLNAGFEPTGAGSRHHRRPESQADPRAPDVRGGARAAVSEWPRSY